MKTSNEKFEQMKEKLINYLNNTPEKQIEKEINEIKKQYKDVESPYMEDYFKDLLNIENIKLKNNEWIEIQTPFVGLFNDLIILYVKKDKNKIIISDDGDTLTNLELAGIKLKENELNKILNKLNVKLINDELTIETDKDNFMESFLKLIVCIIRIINYENDNNNK